MNARNTFFYLFFQQQLIAPRQASRICACARAEAEARQYSYCSSELNLKPPFSLTHEFLLVISGEENMATLKEILALEQVEQNRT